VKRVDCLEHLSTLVTDQLVVIGMAGANWEWNQLSQHQGNMKIGSMGNATAVGLGMAMSLPHRRVIVLDSDGSVLLDLATLTTLGTYRPPNLSIFVFDNEVYSGSGISQPSATAFHTDIEAIARGAGIPDPVTVRDLDGFVRCADGSTSASRLTYCVAKVAEDLSAQALSKPTKDFLEHKYHFVRYIEATEHVTIFPTHG
jgi:thiamine pyrophosphate-dependent acetolactate synthase large subunit-like protein